MAKKGLGKGFDSLIPSSILNSEFDTTASEDGRVSDLRHLKISDITPDPDQPRRNFKTEELNSLAESIKEHGVLQPIVVVPKKNGSSSYVIVAGERRWRASKLAGLKTIPAIIRTLSSQHRLEISIIENAQRQDLNALELATAYFKLRTQFNLTDSEISHKVGKAQSTISNTMRMLRLPDSAKKALIDGLIQEGHARQILAIPDPEVQECMLKEIINNKWTVARAEQFVIGYKKGSGHGMENMGSARRAVRSETNFTRNFAKRLGFKSGSVTQKTTAHGGQIIIKYKNDNEMEQIASKLGFDL